MAKSRENRATQLAERRAELSGKGKETGGSRRRPQQPANPRQFFLSAVCNGKCSVRESRQLRAAKTQTGIVRYPTYKTHPSIAD
jgi:hypothetical protein